MKKLGKQYIETGHFEYANGEGFITAIAKAPKENPADIIAFATLKGKKCEVSYYTPDEAMAVAIGLLRAVDYAMSDAWKKFRMDYHFKHK